MSRHWAILLTAALVVTAGTGSVFAVNHTDEHQQDGKQVVTVQDLSVETITLENVQMNNLTMASDQLDRSADSMEGAPSQQQVESAVAEKLQGVTVGGVMVEDVTVHHVTVTEGTVTFDASIGRLSVHEVSAASATFMVSADQLQRDGQRVSEETMENEAVIQSILGTQAVTVGDVTVEGLEVGDVSVRPASSEMSSEQQNGSSQADTGSQADAGSQAQTVVTVQNPSVERITLENVQMAGVTVSLDRAGAAMEAGSEQQIESAVAENLQGVTVGEVMVEDVNVNQVTVSEGTVTFDATVGRMVLEGVTSDTVTVQIDDSTRNDIMESREMLEDTDVVRSMVESREMSVGDVTVEGLEVGDVSASPGGQAAVDTDGPGDSQEETPTGTSTETPTETATETEDGTPTDAQDGTPTDAQDGTPTDAQEDTPNGADGESPTETNGPGFGFIAVLLALVGVAIIHVRKR